MTTVNTVLGPLSPDKLGMTLMHEHLVCGYPGWYADLTCAPFDREAAVATCVSMLEQVKRFGVQSVVDPCPADMGRDPELLKEISEKSGVHLICSTGLYFEREGASPYFRGRAAAGADVQSEIYEMFVKEITQGIGKTGIKPGVIKLASSDGEITGYEQLFFRAAARAQRDTGVPIVTHTQNATMGPEQAELLISEGANPKRIMIGHTSDNVNIGYHMRILKTGVYDSFDRMGIQGLRGIPMDVEKCACIIGIIGIGYGDRIMLSHDFVTHWLGRPRHLPEAFKPLVVNHPTHLFKNIIPMLKEGGITDAQINTILVENPRRLFAGE